MVYTLSRSLFSHFILKKKQRLSENVIKVDKHLFNNALFRTLIAKWFIYHKEEKFNDFRLPEGDIAITRHRDNATLRQRDNATSRQRDFATTRHRDNATSRQRDIATPRHYDGWFVPSRVVAMSHCRVVENATATTRDGINQPPYINISNRCWELID